jgi:menaquinol-cytochrome c reductase iron-sulfur subunit
MSENPSLLRRIFRRMTGRQPVERPDSDAARAADRQESDAELVARFTRRNFFGLIGAGTAALAAAVAGVPIVRVLFATTPRREEIWHVVGEINDFPLDETVKVEFSDPEAVPWAGPAARSAAWVRRIGEQDFTAFSIFCTHTGCPVSWRAGANLFICPCHGGVFDREGDVVAGPPEEPLGRHEVRIRDGQVELLATGVPVTGRVPRT